MGSGVVSGVGGWRKRHPESRPSCQSTDTVPIAEHDDVLSSDRKTMFAGTALQCTANVVPTCRVVTSAQFIVTPCTNTGRSIRKVADSAAMNSKSPVSGWLPTMDATSQGSETSIDPRLIIRQPLESGLEHHRRRFSRCHPR